MGVVNLSQYLDEKDEKGVRVGDWATQHSPGFFICKYCTPQKPLSFKEGKPALVKHSQSKKHIANAKASNDSTKHQATMEQMFQKTKDDDLAQKVLDFEIVLVMLLARHGVQTWIIDCIIEVLKKYITDSEIVKKMKVKRTKASYLVNHGISKEFEKETVLMLRNCVAFSCSLDESEVNKVSELEIVVNICTKQGELVTRHYKTIALEGSDSETIINQVLDSFNDDRIDYKSKLIDVGTDGCSVMTGVRNGVQKRFEKEVPDLHIIGHCNAHNLGNICQHSTEAFDSDIKPLMVDVYQRLGGGKGYGTKQMKLFEESCKTRGHVPKPFKKFVNVRFRSIQTCIEPILHNFDELVHFFKNIKEKVKKPNKIDERLIAMFVDRELMTKLKLKFLYAATFEMIEKIDFFEERGAHVHNSSEVLEDILISQMRKIFDETVYNDLDSDTNEVRSKSRFELIEIDPNSAKKLDVKQMFVGSEVNKELRALGLKPSSSQLSWFYLSVAMFHITAVIYMIKYFSKSLRSPIVDNFSALGQSKQSHVLTSRKLKALVTTHSKVVDNIDSIDGQNKIQSEIDKYQVDEDIKMFDDNMEYTEFWIKVSKLTQGADGWEKYEVLPFFALALGCRYSSNSEVERSFSLMNYIYQNKNRNPLSQDSLNNILHIMSKLECSTMRKDCDDCKYKTTQHCHCSTFEITENLRESCRKARANYGEALDNAQEANVILSEEMKLRMENTTKEKVKKMEKLKEKVDNGKKLFKPELLVPVYEKKAKDKDSDKEKKDVNANITSKSVSSSKRPILSKPSASNAIKKFKKV